MRAIHMGFAVPRRVECHYRTSRYGRPSTINLVINGLGSVLTTPRAASGDESWLGDLEGFDSLSVNPSPLSYSVQRPLFRIALTSGRLLVRP